MLVMLIMLMEHPDLASR